MSTLKVLRFPAPELRKIAVSVSDVNAKINTLIDDMFETMYAHEGVGLAATQVNIHQRIFVADCTSKDEAPKPLVFINPEIVSVSESKKTHQEGCLSIPESYADIERPEFCTVRALDREGNEFELACDGLLAVCVQHEIDHLDGKLFIDYLSPIKRNQVREKMKKYEKRLAREGK